LRIADFSVEGRGVREDDDIPGRLANRTILGFGLADPPSTLTSLTPRPANSRTMSSVRSVEPSEATMISSFVCG